MSKSDSKSRWSWLAGVVLGSWLLAGCSSTVTRTVVFESDPPGATVYVNGIEKGTADGRAFTLDFGGSGEDKVLVHFVKEGRKPRIQTFTLAEVQNQQKMPPITLPEE